MPTARELSVKRVAAIIALAACGRVGFDPLGGHHPGGGDDDDDDDSGGSGSDVIPQDGLVYDFPMDGTVTDVARGHALMHLVTTTSAFVPGVHGQALVLTNDAYIIEYASDLDADPLTLAMWLRLEAVPSIGQTVPVVAKAFVAGEASYGISIDKMGDAVEVYASSTSNGQHADSNLTIGVWHHVAMTWDGSQIHTFFDGVDDDTVSTSIAFMTNGTALSSLGVDGDLDDLLLYNRVLSGEEIAQLAKR